MDFIFVALDEYQQVFPKALLDVFGLVPINGCTFIISYKFEKRVFFLVAQTINGLYLLSQSCLVNEIVLCKL